MYKANEKVLFSMISIVRDIGTVTSANWYEDGYITVSGVTGDGAEISMSLVVKEEKKDA